MGALGTQYRVDANTNRESGTFTGGLSVYNSNVGLTLTQPLLRNYGKDANLATIRKARNGQGIADAQVEITVLQAIGDTIKAYWDLVGAIELLDVRKESFDNAMRLLRINEQRLDIGTAAAIEVLQAKANAATRQGNLITARTSILNSEDVLKNYIGMQDGNRFSSDNIIPIDRPGTRDFAWDMNETMDKAVQNRPEVRTAKLQLANAETDVDRTRNLLKPQLDITGSYRPNDRSFDFGDSYQGVWDRNGRIWSVGITGSIPLGNRTAKGNFRRAELSLRKQEQTITKVEQEVMLAARTALRNVLNSQILVEANKQARILEEANAAAEERRLLLGVTTTQNVLDRQEDLTVAQLNELQATIDFEKALVDLRVADGTLLTELGINYDELVFQESNGE
jgi:outer membrane protein TolC